MAISSNRVYYTINGYSLTLEEIGLSCGAGCLEFPLGLPRGEPAEPGLPSGEPAGPGLPCGEPAEPGLPCGEPAGPGLPCGEPAGPGMTSAVCSS